MKLLLNGLLLPVKPLVVLGLTFVLFSQCSAPQKDYYYKGTAQNLSFGGTYDGVEVFIHRAAQDNYEMTLQFDNSQLFGYCELTGYEEFENNQRLIRLKGTIRIGGDDGYDWSLLRKTNFWVTCFPKCSTHLKSG